MIDDLPVPHGRVDEVAQCLGGDPFDDAGRPVGGHDPSARASAARAGTSHAWPTSTSTETARLR